MFDSIRSWLSKHRKAVFVTATILAISGTVAVVLINRKKVEIPVEKLAEQLVPKMDKLAESIAQIVEVKADGVTKTFQRGSFIRQLPEGWKASQAKIAEASALNIDLKPGETLVKACEVTMRVAA